MKIGEFLGDGSQVGNITLKAMNMMKIIKEIFLVEQGIQKKVSSPKNLTSHYEKEL